MKKYEKPEANIILVSDIVTASEASGCPFDDGNNGGCQGAGNTNS